MRQKGIGRELGELTAPEIGAQDLLLGHPIGIDLCQGINSGWIITTDQHPIGSLQITDGRSFRQKLRIGKHRERALIVSLAGGFQDGLDRCSRTHGQGALLHNNRVARGGLRHGAGTSFHPTEIAGLTSPQAFGLGGGVH